jgi:hypothetical protein
MYMYQWTWPNLGFTVTYLSRYLHKPDEKHMQATKHTLHYLNRTIGLRIHYTLDLERLRVRDQQLNVMYTLLDSDFTRCKDMSRSTFG